jgi:hypothetical protein
MIEKDANKFEEIKFNTQRFIAKNVMFFGLLFIIINIWGVIVINGMKTELKGMKEAQIIASKSAIGLDNGVVVGLERNIISPRKNVDAILLALEKLVVSRAEITKNFTISQFDNLTQIVENSKSLDDFFSEYIVISQGKNEENTKIEKMGIGYFTSYVESLKELIRENKLPHMLNITEYSYDEDTFWTEASKFQITAKYKILMNIYDTQTQKWQPKKGEVIISARGFLDIDTRTKFDAKLKTKGLNGLGIHFESFRVTYPNIEER